MIAALPMYDWPETAADHDRLWAAIRDALRARGIAAPDNLDRDTDLMAGWTRPDLVLGQTCGLPYRTVLHGRVALIGTFDLAVPGCPPGHYNSVFVARADDPRDDVGAFCEARFVFNQPDSHSGWAAPQTYAAARGFWFRAHCATGGHRGSARAVADGLGDLAAIDAHTWAGILRHLPDLAGRLRVIGQTDAAPGLPLIAAPDADIAGTRAAIATAMDRQPEVFESLGIRDLLMLPADAYLSVPTPEAPAQFARMA